MLFTSVLRALPAALLLTGVQSGPVDHQKRQTSIDSFITSQADISIEGVLANIGTDGSKAQGVPAGIVVASPSRTDPDCEYTYCSTTRHELISGRLVHLDKRCCLDLQGACGTFRRG
mgnify:CR=1 FL=1